MLSLEAESAAFSEWRKHVFSLASTWGKTVNSTFHFLLTRSGKLVFTRCFLTGLTSKTFTQHRALVSIILIVYYE